MTLLPEVRQELYETAARRAETGSRRTIIQRPGLPLGPWGRLDPRLTGRIAALAGVLIATAVAAVAVITLGHTTPTHASRSSASRAPTSTRQLVSMLAILQRPQTHADRTLPPGIAQRIAQRWRPAPSLTRLVATFSAGRLGKARVYLVVLVPPPRAGAAAVAEVTILDHRVVSTGPALLETRGLRRPSPFVGLCSVALCSIVPDGVAHARWVLGLLGKAGAQQRAWVYPTIRNNLAFAPISSGYVQLVSATWYDRDGHVIGSYTSPAGSRAARGSPVPR